jgi:hypothetical protein
MRRTAILLVGLLLVGCPDSGSTNPSPGGGTNPPPVAPPPVPSVPPPPPPPPRPKEGWGLVGVGSSFETVTRTHFENGLPDIEKTTVQTVVGMDAEGVSLHVESRQAGVPLESQDPKASWKSLAGDPNAKKPETAHESVTVKAGTFECEVTAEKVADGTLKTWLTKSLPVPVKTEMKSEGVTSTSELIRADVKPPRD